MNTRRYLLLTLAGLALSSGGQAQADVSAKQVGRNVTQAADSTAAYAEQERDKYVRKSQAEIDDIRAGIDKLGLKARTARDELKTKLDKDMAALDRKRDAAERKLGELKSANASAWKHLKAGMDDALEDLKQSFARARKDFE